MRGIYARTLYFLCQNPEDNFMHINRLEAYLKTKIYKTNPQGLCEDTPKHLNKIIIVDYSSSSSLLKTLALLDVNIAEFDTILINVTKRLTTDELLKYGNLKGLFFKTETTDKIATGVQEVINGQNWLPRKVTSQLLHYYRKTLKPPKPAVVVNLTTSELQILKILPNSSNKEIAQTLCITEHTVKSHLYQIFRKLSVKKRSQAIAWADHYLLQD